MSDAGNIRAVVLAEEGDFQAWIELAHEVEPLFGPMVEDEQFHRALHKNIARRSAFCVRSGDGIPGVPLLGGLMWSAHPPKHQIGWLAVTASHRQCGIGRRLVEHAIQTIQVMPASVLVTTFGDSAPGGVPARAFYRKLGFTQRTEGSNKYEPNRVCLELTLTAAPQRGIAAVAGSSGDNDRHAVL